MNGSVWAYCVGGTMPRVVVQELVAVQATSAIQAACVAVTYVFIKATEYGAFCLTVSYPCTPPVTSTVGLAESHPRVLTANRGYLPTQTNARHASVVQVYPVGPRLTLPYLHGGSCGVYCCNARESRSRLRPHTHRSLSTDRAPYCSTSKVSLRGSSLDSTSSLYERFTSVCATHAASSASPARR